MAVMIRTEGLAKAFDTTRALDGVDLEVAGGTVLGLLGPNGAASHRGADPGHPAGPDRRPRPGRRLRRGPSAPPGPPAHRSGRPVRRRRRVPQRDREPVHARLAPRHGKAQAGRRAAELLNRFDLADAAGRTVKTYSGRMRRRLDLVASLVGRPPVLFLDEPTTGLTRAAATGCGP